MGGTCGKYRGEERSIQGSDGENEVKRISGRPRHRWERSIKLGKAIPLQTLTGSGGSRRFRLSYFITFSST